MVVFDTNALGNPQHPCVLSIARVGLDFFETTSTRTSFRAACSRAWASPSPSPTMPISVDYLTKSYLRFYPFIRRRMQTGLLRLQEGTEEYRVHSSPHDLGRSAGGWLTRLCHPS